MEQDTTTQIWSRPNEAVVKPEPIASTQLLSAPDSAALSKQKRPQFQKWNIWLATVGVVLCIVATVLVVAISNGQPVHQWKVRPSVLVAILSSVVSVLLGYLLSTGIAVRWWSSVHRGASLETLHQISNRGILLQPQNWKWKLFEDSNFTKIFLGSLAIVLSAFLSQPFIQQSTRSTVQNTQTLNDQRKIDILPEIPDGLSGAITYASTYNTSASFDFTAAAVQWYLNNTILTRDDSQYTCNGTCFGTVNAPGISVECATTSEVYDLNQPSLVDKDLFSLNFTLKEDETSVPYIQFTAIYSQSVDTNCNAIIVTEQCKIYSAKTQTPIKITGNSINLVPRTYLDLDSTVIVTTPGDSVSLNDGDKAGPLHGLMYLGDGYFNSWTRLRRVGAGRILPTRGLVTEIFYIYSNQTVRAKIPKVCDLTWRRPTDYVLNAMSETLFRLAMNGNSIANSTVIGNATPVMQAFPVRHVRTEFVFQSNFGWLASGIVVEVLATTLALILVWGWWGLGREVTLSPVETLQSIPSITLERDMSADEVVDKFGWMQVRYIPKVG